MKSVILRAKKRVLSSRVGLFQSRSKEGVDFDELVEYDFQSDARKIDWLSYARTGELYQKRYLNENARNILIVPILTGSLLFGYDRLVYERVIEAAALLAFSAILGKDKTHILCIVGDKATSYHPQNFPQAQQALEKIAQSDILGVDFAYDFSRLFSHPKSLIVLLGDFLYRPDLKLIAAKHDVVCVMFQEPVIPYEEPINLTDNVTLQKRGTTLGKRAVQKYLQRREAFHQELASEWIRERIDHTIIENEPIFEKLQLFFGRR